MRGIRTSGGFREKPQKHEDTFKNERKRIYGKVAEWFKVLAWKASVREIVPGVRIPPFPQFIAGFSDEKTRVLIVKKRMRFLFL